MEHHADALPKVIRKDVVSATEFEASIRGLLNNFDDHLRCSLLAHLPDVLRGCSFLPASKTLEYFKKALFGQELVLYFENDVVGGLLNDLDLTRASQMLDYTALVEHLLSIEDVIANGSENLIKAKYFRP